MDEIEVVIRIPEEWIEQFKAFKHPSTLETIILQGTVLPKGHGRLIDADAVNMNETIGGKNEFADCIREAVQTTLNNASTIIEADKEVEG